MGFFKSLFHKITNRAEIDWDDLEAELIAADLGVKGSMSIVAGLQKLGRKISAEDVIDAARKHVKQLLVSGPVIPAPPEPGKTRVIMVVGVNGVGKTTSCAKLAFHLKKQGYRCLLAAADTFRAAAVEQLERWGQRLDIPVVRGNPNADPSSVCFTAHQKALAQNFDYLICDTAGRLHTRHNLMEELAKIRRVIAKNDDTAPHVSLLVVDATTGSNALQQAKEFHKACPLDGLILTKMDGSGRGGVAVMIQEQLQIPTCFIGTGEEPDAFAPFDHESFVNEMIIS